MAQNTIKQPQSVAPSEYKLFLKDIKGRILASQIKAAVAVNRELLELYWEIGSALRTKLQETGWGSKAVEKLSMNSSPLFLI